jgi:hypothetical protein
MPERLERLVQLSDLGEQQVHGEQAEHEPQQGHRVDPSQPVELGCVATGALGRNASQLGQRIGLMPKCGAGRRRQRQRLEQRQRPDDGRRPQDLDGGVHGPVWTHEQGGRRHQLGNVLRQPAIAGRQLREPEVDDPRLPVATDEHVGGAQVAVGDLRPMEPIHLLPDGVQQRRRQRRRLEAGERPARHVLQDEQRRPRPRLHAGDGAGDPHAGPRRQQKEQCLVLDLLLRRDEGCLVLDVAQHDIPP